MPVTDAPAPRSEAARLAVQIERLTQHYASAEREHSRLQSAHADAMLESDEPFSNAKTAALRRQVADKSMEVDEIARALREAKIRHADALAEEARAAHGARWQAALQISRDEWLPATRKVAAAAGALAEEYRALCNANGRLFHALPDAMSLDQDALMLRRDLIAGAIKRELVRVGCDFAGRPELVESIPAFAARAEDAAAWLKVLSRSTAGKP